MIVRWLSALFAAAWLLALGADPAAADELRPGYIAFEEQAPGTWRLVWKAPLRGGVTPATQPVLPAGCTMQGEGTRTRDAASVIRTLTVLCTGPVAGGRIGLSSFDTSQTDVLVRVAPLGASVQALRLTAAEPVATIAARAGRGEVAWTYFVTGIDHILFGYDHLLFVVALVLLLQGFWTIAKAVTAFTVAHSLTLVGTTLGLVGLPGPPVEAVIALSILFLAVEIVKRTPGAPRLSERIPWVVAFAFGLLHGFGFAGALAEIGLPEGEVPTALLTFNLGVEAGQLAVVAVVLAVQALVQRLAPRRRALVETAAAYGIGSIAAMWLIDRMVG